MTKNKNILVISVLVILAIIVIAIIMSNSNVAVAPANTTNTTNTTNTSNTTVNINTATNTANNTNTNKNTSTGGNTNKATNTDQLGTPTKTSYSATEVAAHKTASDCWSIVNGNVYNLTSWISQHPGGSRAIISMCGIDASAAYGDQHGNKRRPANELAGFIIGSQNNN